MHLQCLQNDYEDISQIEILDFSEFHVDLISVVEVKKNEEEEK